MKQNPKATTTPIRPIARSRLSANFRTRIVVTLVPGSILGFVTHSDPNFPASPSPLWGSGGQGVRGTVLRS